MVLSKKVIDLINQEREKFREEYPYDGISNISNPNYVKSCWRSYADKIRPKMREIDLFQAESIAKSFTKAVV